MCQRFLTLLLIISLVITSNLSFAGSGTPAAEIRIRWSFIENQYHGSGFLAKLSISTPAAEQLPPAGWRLYFSLRYHGTTLTSENKDILIRHKGGDLFCLTPVHSFKGLKPGTILTIPFTGSGAIANYQDAPSGFFWVEGSGDVAYNIPAKHIILDPGSLSGADGRKIFDLNKGIRDLPAAELPPFIPRPSSYLKKQGYFRLDRTIRIVDRGGFKDEANYLASQIREINGDGVKFLSGKKNIILKRGNLPAEAYQLNVMPNSIVLTASNGAGIFYGIQSLKNLLPADVWRRKRSFVDIPCVNVCDSPRFRIRAFMLDVARNFQPKSEILKLLDLMALYKLNTFHFHLTDDEGWRLQIEGLPELTHIGAMRGYPYAGNKRLQPSYGSGAGKLDKAGSGFYTRQDFIAILKYAKMRHITVMPEIESPGHARAAVKAMEARYWKYRRAGNLKKATAYLLTDLQDKPGYNSAQYFNDNVINPALPSTYRFVAKVVDEIKAMYRAAGVDLKGIHLGGDEVPEAAWKGSAVVRAMLKKDSSLKDMNAIFRSYFMHVQAILNQRRLKLYAWEELTIGTQKSDGPRKAALIPEFLEQGVSVDAWYNIEGNEDVPYQIANAGYKTLLTCIDYFYFDLAYDRSFFEPGDEWLGILDTKKTLSFIPFDYYRNDFTDLNGTLHPEHYFNKKQGLLPEARKNILGVQGALWGENVKSPGQMEYLILPRLLALAEKAWAEQPQFETEEDSVSCSVQFNRYWNTFANQIGKQDLPRLSWYHGGYHFRIPAPGVALSGGTIIGNQQFPGMTIHYTTDGSLPTRNDPVYHGPLSLHGTIKMRIIDERGRGGESTSAVF